MLCFYSFFVNYGTDTGNSGNSLKSQRSAHNKPYGGVNLKSRKNRVEEIRENQYWFTPTSTGSHPASAVLVYSKRVLVYPKPVLVYPKLHESQTIKYRQPLEVDFVFQVRGLPMRN
ncbi:hypothetical protein HaLaN_07261 [Haematococcus lacustris]|uniref:Uncharacterized protein n=1 Tax=Haematococcus lacustris TaxID=44745 RepID=A0A699YXH8_HAELA|nr:hypothetical protein HaLaN_07261 [Haematococcus lacustris]